MASLRKAERNQRRKRQYLPPVWPLIAGIALVIIIVWLVHR
jgi:hypothetical protein